MFKRWVFILLLIAGGGLLGASPVAAVSTGNNQINNCISIKGKGDICPDKFCDPSTATCSNDGNRCFCKPRALTEKMTNSVNNKCEIAFGSKMYYFYVKGSEDPIVYLTGGIWSEITDGKGVIFEKVPGKTSVYRSKNFLTETAKKIDQSNSSAEIELNINIPKEGAIGKARNQTFFSVINAAKERCSIHHHNDFLRDETNLNGLFFLKGSIMNDFDHNNTKDSCLMPTTALLSRIFGSQRSINATKNCTDKKAEDFFAEVSMRIFQGPLGDNYDLLLATSNLVVPQNQARSVYYLKPKNYYLGRIFNKGSKASSISVTGGFQINVFKRLLELEKIEQKFAKKCRDLPESKIDKENRDFCNQYNQNIINQLKGNSQLDFETALASNLGSDEPDPKVCKMINNSYDTVRTKIGKYFDNQVDFIDNIKDFDKIDPKSSDQQEELLNDQLAPGVIQLCDNLDDANRRKKCKQNSLDCYRQNADVAEPLVGCSNLIQNKNLDKARWLICPTINTSVSSNQSLKSRLLEIIRAPSDFIGDQDFVDLYNKFVTIANILLIIVFLIIVFSQLTSLGLNNYQIKKSLPSFVIATIAINLSLFLNGLLIDLSNIAGSATFGMLEGMANSIDDSFFDFFQILATAGPLVIMALVAAGPLIMISLIGFLVASFILAVRKGLIILLVLTMPIAIIALILPGSKKFFNSWLKKYLTALMLYPVVALVFGSGILVQRIIFGVFESGMSTVFNKIVGFFMPGIALIMTPAITKKLVYSIVDFSQAVNMASSKPKQLSKNMTGAQANKANFDNWRKNLFIKHFPLGEKILRNRAFNKVTYGAGVRSVNSYNQRLARFNNDFSEILKKDPKILETYLREKGTKGAAYNSLTKTQRLNYDKLVSFGAISNPNFYSKAIEGLMANKSVDDDLLKMLIIESRKYNPGTDEDVFVTHSRAVKKGLVGLSSKLTTYLGKNKQGFSIDQLAINEAKIGIASNGATHNYAYDSSRFIIKDFVKNQTSVGAGAANSSQKTEAQDEMVDKLANGLWDEAGQSKKNKISDQQSFETIRNLLGDEQKSRQLQQLLVDNAQDVARLQEGYNLIEKVDLEKVSSKDLKNTIKIVNFNTNEIEQKSVVGRVIKRKLNQNFDQANVREHYISRLAKKWNFLQPAMKKELEEVVLEFASENSITGDTAEQVFEQIGLTNLRIKL